MNPLYTPADLAAYLLARLGRRRALALAHRAAAVTGRYTPQLVELIALLAAAPDRGRTC